MGGNTPEFDEKDMYAHDDRGVYFNGFNKFLTINDIIISSTFTISTWVKPQSVGTILSVSSSQAVRMAWAVIQGQMQFRDEHHGLIQDFHLVKFYFWQHLAITLKQHNGTRSSVLSAYHNNENCYSAMIEMIFMDDIAFDHTIGVTKRNGQYTDFMRGFMYTLRIQQVAADRFDDEFSKHCDACDVCVVDTCLGTCNWKHYWNGIQCGRCPKECHLGCSSDGTCPEQVN